MPVLSSSTFVNAYGKVSISAAPLESINESQDIFIVKYDTLGRSVWSSRIGSTGGTDIGYGICTDSSGSVYVTGQTTTQSGTNTLVTVFNRDGTAFCTLNTLNTSTNAFVVKYNINGVVQWAARIESSVGDTAYAIAADSSGNVYVTGGTSGVLTAYNANGTAFGTTIPNSLNNDVFIVKYNTNGLVQWMSRIASSGDDLGYGIATDSSGNVYVTGQGGSGAVVTAYNADGSAFGTTIANSGGTDTFVVKYDTNGLVQWVAKVASTGSDIGYGIATDSSGNVYLTGEGGNAAVITAYNSDSSAFGTTLSNSGGNDAFVVKYNTSGTVQWVAKITSTANDTGFGITADSSGNVYVTGRGGSNSTITAFSANGVAFGTTLANTGNTDVFTVKYDTNGVVQWVAKVATTSGDIGYAIAADSSGNVYVTGQGGSVSTITAFNSNGTAFGTTLANIGSNDAFIVKYNTSGTVQWVTKIASSQTDTTRSINVDSNGNIVTCGTFSGKLFSISAEPLTVFSTLPNSGAEDAFIVKYNANGDPQWGARIASTGTDTGYRITADSSGNVYATGVGGSGAVVSVYNADGSAFGTTIANSGGTDAFVVKYNTNGVVQWVTRIASTAADIGYGIATDSSGNVYVTGQRGSGVVGTAYNSDGTAFGTTIANAGGADTFIVKYNTDGFVQWVARVAGTLTEQGRQVATDSNGNIYTTGQTGGNGAIAYSSDGSAFATTLPAISGSADSYVIKYNTSGFVQWVAKIGSINADIGYDITTDPSGNVFVVGSNDNTLTANNSDGTAFGTTLTTLGSSETYIVKYNTNGFVQWVAKIGSTATDIGYGVAADSNGSVYVTGQGGSSSIVTAYNADGTSFNITLACSGSNDAFIVKYNTNGVVQWVNRVASASVDIGYGAATDTTGNMFLTLQSGDLLLDVTVYKPDTEIFAVVPSSTALVKYSTNGYPQWIQTIQRANVNVPITADVSTDINGNSYIIGTSGSGTVVRIYNKTTGSFRVLLNSLGGQDVFILKHSSTGRVVWVAQISSLLVDEGYGIATDSSGNVYVTGAAGVGAITRAYSSDGTAFNTTLPAADSGDVFIVKYNINGIVQWITRIASGNVDKGYSVSTDPSGNVYLTGQGGDSAAVSVYNSDGTNSGLSMSNLGGTDAYVVKYNTNGVVQWKAKVGSTGADTGFAITTDSNGNAYVTGRGGSGVTVRAFNANETAFATTLTSSGLSDAFVVKYNTSGSVQWVAKVASTAADTGYSIATDSSGNVYVTGAGGAATVSAFSSDGVAFGTTLANAGLGDMFIVKYDTSGFVQWVARVASTDTDIGYGITTDSSGNIYVTGQGGIGTITVYNSNGTSFATTLTNLGSNDTFIIKYDTSGTVQWVAKVAGQGQDIGYSITTDSAGNVFLTGSVSSGSSSTITAYNSSGTAIGSVVSTSTASNAGFIAKYTSAGDVEWIVKTAGVGTENGRGIAADVFGDVYTIGLFNASTLQFFNA